MFVIGILCALHQLKATSLSKNHLTDSKCSVGDGLLLATDLLRLFLLRFITLKLLKLVLMIPPVE